jgi:hypothetical protein
MTTTQVRQGVSTRSAVPVGIALIVAELLLAYLWYPWVVEHLVFQDRLPFEVLRLLIVVPEYLLLAVAVVLIGLSRARRLGGLSCAALAALVAWGNSILLAHLASTRLDLARHHDLLKLTNDSTLILVPTLGALAWGLARRQGGLWLLAVPVAPALHWWLQHTDWTFRVQQHVDFRGSEAIGMAFVIVPVLLAILAGWVLEQVAAPRSAAPSPTTYDEGPPPRLR